MAMRAVNNQLESKRNVAAGTYNQVKGVAREQWGKVTHNPKTQLSGKKDQVVGTLQKSVGNSWPVRHKNIVLAFTTLAALTAAVFYFINRANSFAIGEHYGLDLPD
ncbi:MAG: CsbD family protein [Candidatus Promineifilaceae bacterium]